MFLTVNFKPFIAFILIIIGSFTMAYLIVNGISNASAKNLLDFTIVLDAGHGGMDGGTVGISTGIKESDLNLNITQKLEKYLTSFGFNVILTRKDANGLYNVFSRDYKQEDMQKRKEIINKSRANIVVSIHMNSFPIKSLSGAQVYYYELSDSSKLLADTIQQSLKDNLPNARQSSNFGDYYILKCTQNPSVMIECGFLSNAEEELLLSDKDYQEKMAYFIFCGIVKYFQVANLN